MLFESRGVVLLNDDMANRHEQLTASIKEQTQTVSQELVCFAEAPNW